MKIYPEVAAQQCHSAEDWKRLINCPPGARRGMLERLSKRQREATPEPFAQALLSLALNAGGGPI